MQTCKLGKAGELDDTGLGELENGVRKEMIKLRTDGVEPEAGVMDEMLGYLSRATAAAKEAEEMQLAINLGKLEAAAKATEQEVEREVAMVVKLLHEKGLSEEGNKLNSEVQGAMADGNLDALETQGLSGTVAGDAEQLRVKDFPVEADEVAAVAARLDQLSLEKMKLEEAVAKQGAKVHAAHGVK